jgi:peptidoglycan/xylan/chitin deacetylase (PgdA/CDA1 family)
MLKENVNQWTTGLGRKLNDQEVCFSFDDGPADARTLDIAEFLAAEGIRATFFVVGQCIERPGGWDALAKMRKLGHMIANHTYTHPFLTELVKEGEEPVRRELVRTHELISKLVGEGPLLFRPPFGAWNEAVCRAANSAGEMEKYRGPIMCDIHCFDWDLGKERDGILWDVPHCQQHLMGQFQKLQKGILLLHDGSSAMFQTEVHARREEQVYQLVKWLVGWLKHEKYQFVGLDDLMARAE